MIAQGKILHIGLILLTACSLSFSHEEQSSELSGYVTTLEHISIPNFSKVNSIFRDERGFIWIGTTTGLCKYDGYEIRTLPIGYPSDTKHLEGPLQTVTAITTLGPDSILVATLRGLWTFDLTTELCAPFLPGNQFSESEISSLLKSPDGTIWIGTVSQGMFSYSRTERTIQHYSTKNGLSNDHVTSLLVDHSGKLWIGTVAGGIDVLELSDRKFVNYSKDIAVHMRLSSDHITALCENGDSALWIGTNNGLNVLEFASGKTHQVDLHSPLQHTITSIVRDPAGKMWFSASDLGMFFSQADTLTQFTFSADADRSFNTTKVLYVDPTASTRSELLLWVGTRNGVDKIMIAKKPFINHIRNQNGLQLDRGAVLSLYEDRSQMLWVGLWGGGLNGLRRAGQSYKRVFDFQNNPMNPNTLPNNDVGSIVEDNAGNLWIGTRDGLAVLDKNRKRLIVEKHIEGDSSGLVSNNIIRVSADRSGNLWICTDKGVSRLVGRNPDRFKTYLNDRKYNHPLGGNAVSEILEDHLSDHWIATLGNGLIRMAADGSLKQFLAPGDSSGTRENWISNLVEDKRGLIWLSTPTGLVSFDPRSAAFHTYMIDELLNAHIFGIAPTDTGWLWLSTSIGLVKFDPRTNSIIRFANDQGLSFSEFFSEFLQSQGNRLFVGGVDGFTEFSPDSIRVATQPPVIVITGFTVLGKEFPVSTLRSGTVHLAYDQNFFSFDFAALDYANPRNNKFAYRMVGVEDDWIDAGTQNSARYTHLDPGRYVFQVKGSNSQNVWNQSGTSLSIIIAPPFWTTWWFRFLVIVALGTSIYLAFRYRLQKLLEVERLRMRIADDLHDDVGSNLSTIAIVSRSIQQARELSADTREKLAEIYSTATSTSEGMKDIVWFIKPRNDKLDDLVLRMKDTASTMLTDLEHEFRIAESEDWKADTRITLEFKRNFFLAFKEIVTNIIRHASATNVQFQLSSRDGMLELFVLDNGRGFQPGIQSMKQHGHGLTSLQNRARALHGICEVTSEPGKGTTVRFSGKL